jgi:hypothetical protein
VRKVRSGKDTYEYVEGMDKYVIFQLTHSSNTPRIPLSCSSEVGKRALIYLPSLLLISNGHLEFKFLLRF